MKNINIKDLLGNGEMVYDTLFTEGQFEWFKSNEDAYIYVLNKETKRCTRYNAEAQNGKRISVNEYEAKMAEAMLRAAQENGDDLTDEMLAQAIEDMEFEEAIREFEEERAAEEAEEALESAQSMEEASSTASAPKAKKNGSRGQKKAKKTAAFAVTVDGTEIALTEKQVDFIRHLPDTDFWERGLDSCIWVDVLCDQIGGQFEGKPMIVGAMISTICEKGLGVRSKERVNGKKCTAFALTGLGKVVAAELGLK